MGRRACLGALDLIVIERMINAVKYAFPANKADGLGRADHPGYILHAARKTA
jgi:hypothetical protein